MITNRWMWSLAAVLMVFWTTGCSGDHSKGTPAASSSTDPPTISDAGAIVDPGSPGIFGVGYVEVPALRPEVQIAAWYPTDVTHAGSAMPKTPGVRTGPFPVVLLAPGDAGSGKSFTYLAEHLASWGYVVVSGTTTDSKTAGAGLRFEEMWEGLSTSNNTTAQLLRASLRTTKIALIAASSAAAAPFDQAGGLDTAAVVVLGAHPAEIVSATSSRIPAMIMWSGTDADPTAVRRLFANAGPDVHPYIVHFPDGVQDSFVDACQVDCSRVFTQQRAHELITRYVTAFLQTYVRGDLRYVRDLSASSTEPAEDEDDRPDVIVTRIGR